MNSHFLFDAYVIQLPSCISFRRNIFDGIQYVFSFEIAEKLQVASLPGTGEACGDLCVGDFSRDLQLYVAVSSPDPYSGSVHSWSLSVFILETIKNHVI